MSEFLGTFAIVLVTCGVVIATLRVPDLGAVLVAAALGYGLITAAALSAFGGPARVQLNPALTIAALFVRRDTALTAAVAIAGQLSGAVAGAMLLRAVVFTDAWSAANGGVPTTASQYADGRAFLLEATLAALVTFAYLTASARPASAATSNAPGSAAVTGAGSWAIGGMVAACVLMAAPLTGGSLNPARWLGPALTAGEWSDLLVYAAAPFAGAVVAVVLWSVATGSPLVPGVRVQLTRD